MSIATRRQKYQESLAAQEQMQQALNHQTTHTHHAPTPPPPPVAETAHGIALQMQINTEQAEKDANETEQNKKKRHAAERAALIESMRREDAQNSPATPPEIAPDDKERSQGQGRGLQRSLAAPRSTRKRTRGEAAQARQTVRYHYTSAFAVPHILQQYKKTAEQRTAEIKAIQSQQAKKVVVAAAIGAAVGATLASSGKAAADQQLQDERMARMDHIPSEQQTFGGTPSASTAEKTAPEPERRPAAAAEYGQVIEAEQPAPTPEAQHQEQENAPANSLSEQRLAERFDGPSASTAETSQEKEPAQPETTADIDTDLSDDHAAADMDETGDPLTASNAAEAETPDQAQESAPAPPESAAPAPEQEAQSGQELSNPAADDAYDYGL
jgi:hypothetical protein